MDGGKIRVHDERLSLNRGRDKEREDTGGAERLSHGRCSGLCVHAPDRGEAGE